MALLSGPARTEIEDVVHRIEKIETAVEPRFQEHFVAAMSIPHQSEAFPNLEGVLELPPQRFSTGPLRRGSRRKRR